MRSYPYLELTRKPLYLAVAARPDIAYVVGVICRFFENTGMGHWKAAKHLLHYLTGTLHMRSVYSLNPPHLFTTFSATPVTEAVQLSSMMSVVVRLLWTRSLRLLHLDNVDGGRR